MLSAPDDQLFQEKVNIIGYPGDKGLTQMWGMKHTIHQIKPEQFEYLIDTNAGQSGSGIWISKFGATMILGVHTTGGKYTNTGVRLSKEKFEALIKKIAESYEREKSQGSAPQPILHAPLQPTLPASAFGKAKWALYFGDVGIEPPLPPNIDKILNAPCPFWSDKKVHETHLLTLIPQTVNGRPFTLNSHQEILQNPLGGYLAKYNTYWDEIQKDHGNTVSSNSYWLLMTNNIIPKSERKTANGHKKLLATIKQKTNLLYDMPLLLEAATSISMEYVQRGNTLYGIDVNTRCKERVLSKPNSTLVVGGEGCGVRIYYYDDLGIFPTSANGVAGALKL